MTEGCRATRPWGPKRLRTDAERRASTRQRWLGRERALPESVIAAARELRQVCDKDPAAWRALGEQWPALAEAIEALAATLDRDQR